MEIDFSNVYFEDSPFISLVLVETYQSVWVPHKRFQLCHYEQGVIFYFLMLG